MKIHKLKRIKACQVEFEPFMEVYGCEDVDEAVTEVDDVICTLNEENDSLRLQNDELIEENTHLSQTIKSMRENLNGLVNSLPTCDGK